MSLPEPSPPALTPEVMERLQSLAADCGVRLLIVYGSLAGGRGRPESDLDLGALGAPRDIERFEHQVLAAGVHPRPHVVNLDRCNAVLAFAAARTAQVVYERESGGFPAFASLALRRYEDARRFRLADRDAIHGFLDRHRA